jgi:Holliday junction DNA helicase RuvB
MEISIEKDALQKMAARARLTPRIANRLMKRVRDWAQVHGNDIINTEALYQTLELLEIDEHGLEQSDRKILETIIKKYNGGPVGVDAVSATTGEERQTIEDVNEPYLIQIGFLERTNRGRKATRRAYEHLGFDFTDQESQQSLL